MSENGEESAIVVCASYSEANNSYRTSTITSTMQEANSRQTNETINNKQTNKNPTECQKNRRLINADYPIAKQDCFSCTLLSVALFASILNTYLLSFVIKSIQLNNKGIMDGKVSWDEQIHSTSLELFTKLTGKSISVKSIESANENAPLRLEIWPDRANKRKKSYDDSEEDGEDDVTDMVFLSSFTGQKGGFSRKQQSNYMALDYMPSGNKFSAQQEEKVQPSFTRGKLKIGTRSLVLSLLNQANSTAKLKGPILLEFDGEDESITLPSESRLNLSPQLAGSITVKKRLSSLQIFGSLEEDFNVQTRDGNLACTSERTMKLVSKASDLRLTAAGEVRLSAGQLELNFSHLQLSGDGLVYLDSDKQLAANGQAIESSERQQDDSGSAESLRGYNLVSINGLLLAS